MAAVTVASNPPSGRATPSVGVAMATSSSNISLTASSAKEMDEERQKLYQQLDDKVIERERDRQTDRQTETGRMG